MTLPTLASDLASTIALASRSIPYTPGPWRVGITGNNRVYGPDAALEDSGLIAIVYKGAANKHLISAAPELYEALKECATAAENCFRHHYGDNPEGGYPEYLQRAFVALAKAAGE